MLKRLTLTILFTLVAFSAAFADDAPSWLRQAAATGTGTYDKDVEAVVLLDEQQVTLGSDGKLVTVENYAVRILNNEGRKYALARAFYFVSSGKVREIAGWMIRRDGTVKEYDKKSVLD